MLALTRKRGESIVIGDGIEVIVLGVAGDSVKLGIVAPKEMSVHRKEIYEQIQFENKEAALGSIKNTSGLKNIFAISGEKGE